MSALVCMIIHQTRPTMNHGIGYWVVIIRKLELLYSLALNCIRYVNLPRAIQILAMEANRCIKKKECFKKQTRPTGLIGQTIDRNLIQSGLSFEPYRLLNRLQTEQTNGQNTNLVNQYIGLGLDSPSQRFFFFFLTKQAYINGLG